METNRELEKFQAPDHLCLMYNTPQEWKTFTAKLIKFGLEKHEKCLYVFDTHTAREVRDTLKAGGVDVASFETSGQLSILHGNKVYLSGGRFDPDNMIGLMAEETKKALAEGYIALRITCETDWVLNRMPGWEKFLECEARLDRELFSKYPCLFACQYNLNDFSQEFIKELLLIHPRIVRNNKVCSNFYLVPPEKIPGQKDIPEQVQCWLNNIELENSRRRELRSSNQLFRTVFNEVKTVVLVADETGRYIEANKAALDFFECTREEILGKSVWNLEPQEILTGQRPQDLSQFTSQSVERGCLINGRRKVLQLTLIPAAVGDKKCVLGLGQDVTKRQETENEHRLIEDKYRLIVETIEEGIWISNPRGEIIFANQKMSEMLGYTREELPGKIGFELIDTGFNEGTLSTLNLQECAIIQHECKLNCKDGGVVWTRVNASPLFDDEGRYIGNLWTHTDITKRKKIEEAFLKSEEMYRILVDTSPVGMCTIDIDGNLTLVNKAICRMLGYSRIELLGKQFFDFLHPEDKGRVRKEFAEATTLPHLTSAYSIDFRTVCKNGEPIWFSFKPAPLFIGDKVTGYSAVMTNITGR